MTCCLGFRREQAAQRVHEEVDLALADVLVVHLEEFLEELLKRRSLLEDLLLQLLRFKEAASPLLVARNALDLRSVLPLRLIMLPLAEVKSIGSDQNSAVYEIGQRSKVRHFLSKKHFLL